MNAACKVTGIPHLPICTVKYHKFVSDIDLPIQSSLLRTSSQLLSNHVLMGDTCVQWFHVCLFSFFYTNASWISQSQRGLFRKKITIHQTQLGLITKRMSHWPFSINLSDWASRPNYIGGMLNLGPKLLVPDNEPMNISWMRKKYLEAWKTQLKQLDIMTTVQMKYTACVHKQNLFRLLS